MPMVSVCLDVFNYAEFLPRAIESVLAQQGCDFELIIADDCSTDGSAAVAQRYRDPRIKLILNATNLGMVRNRNVALRAATGEFVKPLHADDFLIGTDALATLAEKLSACPGMSLVACATSFVDAEGREVGGWSRFDDRRALAGTTVITRCLGEVRNLIGSPSAVMFRRARAERGFDESFFHMADLEMWFHLLERGCFGYVAEPGCAYRKHARQQTEQDRASMSESDDYAALLTRYLDRNYVALRPWHKRHLWRRAAVLKMRRACELGQPFAVSPVTRFLAGVTTFALRQTRALARLAKRDESPKQFPPGINVAGFFEGQYGIGDASRFMLQAVEASGVAHTAINIRSKVHRNAERTPLRTGAAGNPYRVNLMTFSYDYARRFRRDRGRKFFAGHYNVGLWFGELERLPPRWHSAFDYYDEIWVTSEFCRRAFAEASPVPVVRLPQPLPAVQARPARSEFRLRAETCVFLFTFDYLSEVERKNPSAIVRAFRQAFGKNEDVELVVKSIHASRVPQAAESLRAAAEGLPARFIDEHFSGAEVERLFASVDCYVSLHRAEGLGLGMARAMSLARPVIATGYSGNLAFMDESNSLLVRHRLIELEENHGPYEKGFRWAEPDETHAAELMRWVYENRAAAAALGQRGAESVASTMDVHRTGKAIAARLAQIYDASAASTSAA